MHTYAEHRASMIYWLRVHLELEAALHFLESGWQQKADGRLYPPKGNHSMSMQDAIHQYDMVDRGEEVPF